MIVALLGAECTGKSLLAAALLAHMTAQGRSAALVDEFLRQWCEHHQRTPRPQEQMLIAQEQQRRIEAAAVLHGDVIADTTALMTAIYSDYVFGDTSLYPAALAYHRRCDITLVAGLDIAWQADGIQRDGPHARLAVDALLRKVLDTEKIPYYVVYGKDSARVHHALQAIEYATNSGATCAYSMDSKPLNSTKKWVWQCDKCSDPDCEHRLFGSLTAASPAAASGQEIG